MSETRRYRKFTAQKLELVMASLRGERSIAELCREHRISESLLRRWRDVALDAAAERLAGGQDRSQPANRSAARLRRLRTSKGADFTIVVFPRADHGLLDTPPTDARAMPTVLAWLRDHA